MYALSDISRNLDEQRWIHQSPAGRHVHQEGRSAGCGRMHRTRYGDAAGEASGLPPLDTPKSAALRTSEGQNSLVMGCICLQLDMFCHSDLQLDTHDTDGAFPDVIRFSAPLPFWARILIAELQYLSVRQIPVNCFCLFVCLRRWPMAFVVRR